MLITIKMVMLWDMHRLLNETRSQKIKQNFDNFVVWPLLVSLYMGLHWTLPALILGQGKRGSPFSFTSKKVNSSRHTICCLENTIKIWCISPLAMTKEILQLYIVFFWVGHSILFFWCNNPVFYSSSHSGFVWIFHSLV